MPSIQDEEFGTITIRRSSKASQIRIRIAPDGTFKASMPQYVPVMFLRKMIKTSRDELRKMRQDAIPKVTYYDGKQIGKSHTLIVRDSTTLAVSKKNRILTLDLPAEYDLSAREVIDMLRPIVIKALKDESKAYLPRRLKYLAEQMDCTYERVRFSHASSRWGSCSSTGTISLNIALMKLPHHLIDYVIVHELAHTKEMNHSSDFWALVAPHCPDYKKYRAELAKETPSI